MSYQKMSVDPLNNPFARFIGEKKYTEVVNLFRNLALKSCEKYWTKIEILECQQNLIQQITRDFVKVLH